MKKSAKIMVVAIVILMATMAPCVFSAGQGEGESDGVIKMTLAHHLPPTTVQHESMELFAQKAKEKSNGRLEISVVHSGQLGGQRELVEAVKLGTLEMALGEAGRYESYVTEFGVFSLPFMFKDLDDYHATVDGPIGKEFGKLLHDQAGMEILAWVDGGMRSVFMKDEPTPSVASLKGVKIRTPESAIYVNTFKALGANPTPVAAPEMYSALHSGVVDAMEGSFETAYTYKIFEVADYCLMTKHINTDISWVINAKLLEGLDPELQQALRDAAAEARDWQRAEFSNANEEFKEKLVNEEGMTIITANHEEFLNAVKPVYESLAKDKPKAAAMLRNMGKL